MQRSDIRDRFRPRMQLSRIALRSIQATYFAGREPTAVR